MAYFNNINNADFYPTSPSGEFDMYPFLSRMSANEEAIIHTHDTFTNGWRMDEQPGHMIGSSTSLQVEASFESASSVTPYAVPTHDHNLQPHSGNCRPSTDQSTQSHRYGIVSRDYSFASTVASDVPVVVPTPSSVPLGYCGASQSGTSTSTFYVNAWTLHQHSTGSTRAGLKRRFQPYEMFRAHLNEHRNAEAGPSTLVPPPVPYTIQPTTYPSGGTSEATADARLDQPSTEEDKTATTQGRKRDYRIRYQKDVRRLCVWAQGWEKLSRCPSHEKALAIALEVVEAIRMQVYPEPRLLKGGCKRTAEGTKAADERRRRKGTRGLNQELSRYYLLAEGQETWGCPELLLKVLKDVESLPKPSA